MKLLIVKPDAKLYSIPESITPKGYGIQYYLKSDTVEIDTDDFPVWLASKAPQGDVDGMTIIRLKDVPNLLDKFLKSKLEEK